jgi:hypothetical protein
MSAESPPCMRNSYQAFEKQRACDSIDRVCETSAQRAHTHSGHTHKTCHASKRIARHNSSTPRTSFCKFMSAPASISSLAVAAWSLYPHLMSAESPSCMRNSYQAYERQRACDSIDRVCDISVRKELACTRDTRTRQGMPASAERIARHNSSTRRTSFCKFMSAPASISSFAVAAWSSCPHHMSAEHPFCMRNQSVCGSTRL